jgi:hypothetical protein
MNGQQNLVLPFNVNPVEVGQNQEAVLNVLSAIQRFFWREHLVTFGGQNLFYFREWSDGDN